MLGTFRSLICGNWHGQRLGQKPASDATGGSGFVGAECIVQLLAAGYHVRATLRSLKREAEMREMLKVGGTKLDKVGFARF